MNVILLYSDRVHVSVPSSLLCKLQQYNTAHRFASQFTTYTWYVHHSTEPHCRQQISTSNILYSTLFYHLKNINHNFVILTVE